MGLKRWLPGGGSVQFSRLYMGCNIFGIASFAEYFL